MSVYTDAILGGIAWEAFSKSVLFWKGQLEDFVLRVYIQNELKKLDKLDNKEIEEVSEVIEATIVEIPDEIKEIENKENQKEVFDKYFKKVIIESFKNNKNVKINVSGDEKYIQNSFNNNENSQIEV